MVNHMSQQFVPSDFTVFNVAFVDNQSLSTRWFVNIWVEVENMKTK